MASPDREESFRPQQFPVPETSPVTPLTVAEQRLKDSACVPLHELACGFANGTLVVRGTVPTKYAKRLALACLASIEGVQMVIDLISVQFPFA